tara:strand:+ start:761 stop:991 length:231 start_codon:yes stop_codon:yes gene_type:complete
MIVGAEPRKKLLIIRIDAPLSRQPLVKGERLVRFEVSAAMPQQRIVKGDVTFFTITPSVFMHIYKWIFNLVDCFDV